MYNKLMFFLLTTSCLLYAQETGVPSLQALAAQVYAQEILDKTPLDTILAMNQK